MPAVAGRLRRLASVGRRRSPLKGGNRTTISLGGAACMTYGEFEDRAMGIGSAGWRHDRDCVAEQPRTLNGLENQGGECFEFSLCRGETMVSSSGSFCT
jgi:hypothetical protein